MLHMKNYVKAKSLEEAYELNQKKTNQIIGGMLWLRMGERSIQTGIGLEDLGLDQIEETKDFFSIGAMVSLHELECHQGFSLYTNGAIKESLRHIVGVQFRNLATVGGSIYGRFGFSDVLALFLTLHTEVELYPFQRCTLAEFCNQKMGHEILTKIIVKKEPIHTIYRSFRNTETDFPVITCGTSLVGDRVRVVIGARPGRAKLVEEMMSKDWEEMALRIVQSMEYGSNMRASKEYREHLAQVLLKRNLRELLEEGRKEA